MDSESMTCPHCGEQCCRETVDVGIGVINGPWGCPKCRWSEDDRYDCRGGYRYNERGWMLDQYGCAYPPTNPAYIPPAAGKETTDGHDS